MHIGFITMEPQTLFIPQYVDSNLVLFVSRGDAKLGLIYQDYLVERRLKIGYVYRIPAGSALCLVNVGEGQRLHIICSIDTSESLGLRNFQVASIVFGLSSSEAEPTRPRSLKDLILRPWLRHLMSRGKKWVNS
ncbi:hypothetical protein MLD38_008312 [Melastoma candidum]|uniref:Uncharacterized protein n=1 Tax=Melastoma candidum TaxID=119954 RepID=A0ACB9RTE0_9MYRT|nr:hypothetical protein MLD38_008312 [Melastoma candidum]